ncbi:MULTISPECIES: cob(I)yrinic acid a,c-diamide adenosyltransferase [Proteus]|mgnify:CR=1 FL=1|jgi:cob(I)alamin adenosyltransferase|uniref:cob(I)yrinic acid a,c-diamide adenosyltransferase n=1 Tax=Proteus TaxID=583 RepID=UPI000505CA1E|nr:MULTISPECIES: cob(I)yrinic acid a,c-diamide adenosyltransferase [Proteus]NBN60989.1 cob(I)yrinic acid a,c-diamide adenosyltransferase [Proteus sp. G2639]RNT29238.1 cob(I)yrinic acid a,c-diamide adenosyltransferase [Proteus mirabilis]AYY80511.1 cob(I)yrinic acid a,c-diamide adenosyltransferase [Proteus vulgaris]KGA59182.1 cob(I)yrinic acid a,c-diamide adenosyltransferase [Proteus vulgaris]MBG5972261.1 cob(I)yrinic acid a,c-diamide adenosyltransferase [Proteus vulgaris]
MNDAQHQKRQQRLKEKVDTRIEQAQREQGILMIFTGNGKGKTTAAMGTATRAVGHQKKVGVVQFIKGTWENGERNLLEQFGVPFYVMETGFTWETQDKSADTAACLNTWQYALKLLNDPEYNLVILDEITYMISFNYLPLDEVISAISSRPSQQNVIITGRGCHRKLIELADTVTEMRPIKHAFDSGIKAQKGIDW